MASFDCVQRGRHLEVTPPPLDSSNPYSLVVPDDPYALTGPTIKKWQWY
ncbi:MAG: hypothetical protein MPJ50_16690 [Pirellulales bacterium]|nr:hypothetical protein [Pirellulales bacterium]